MPKKNVILTPEQMEQIRGQVESIGASLVMLVANITQIYGLSEHQTKGLYRTAENLEDWIEKLEERQARELEKAAKEKPPKEDKPGDDVVVEEPQP